MELQKIVDKLFQIFDWIAPQPISDSAYLDNVLKPSRTEMPPDGSAKVYMYRPPTSKELQDLIRRMPPKSIIGVELPHIQGMRPDVITLVQRFGVSIREYPINDGYVVYITKGNYNTG